MPDAPVSEKARAYAAARLQAGRSAISEYEAHTIEMLRSGKLDAHPWVQAFASFEAEVRREAVEQTAAIADMHDHRGDIGKAIRAILDGEAG